MRSAKPRRRSVSGAHPVADRSHHSRAQRRLVPVVKRDRQEDRACRRLEGHRVGPHESRGDVLGALGLVGPFDPRLRQQGLLGVGQIWFAHHHFAGLLARRDDEGGVASVCRYQIAHRIAGAGGGVDVDQCRFAGRLSEPVGHGHHGPLLQPEDVGEVGWEVLEKRLLGGSGVAEHGGQPQRTKEVVCYVADSFLLGHLRAIPFVWWSAVVASCIRVATTLAGRSGTVDVLGDNNTRLAVVPAFHRQGVNRRVRIVTMRAVEVTETGGPEVLRNVEKPTPSPGLGEVLIKAEAIGVNFVDTYFRSGSYPHKLPFVLGAEVGGTVAAVGDGVTTLRAGDRVATADAIGAYAEYCVAPADVVASVPDGVSTDAAAAAILKGMTAHLLIKSVFPVRQGDMVLVHAGAGGVGLILTQWATSLGARVISTASSPEKAELSRKAGAIDVVSYPDDAGGFGAKIRTLTDGKGVAAVYDGVGKSTFDASLASLAVRGSLVLFGAASGPVPPVDPQRLNAAGSVYLTRPSRPHFIRTRDEFTWRTNQLFDAIATGTIKVNASAHYPLKDAAQAHRDLEGRRTVGSVVLTP